MDIIKIIFNAVYQILNIPINLFSFNVSLWQVVIYSLVATILLYIFFRLAK